MNLMGIAKPINTRSRCKIRRNIWVMGGEECILNRIWISKSFSLDFRTKGVDLILKSSYYMPSPIIAFQSSQRRQYYAVASNVGSGPLSYKIRLKCTAKIGNGYWESVEEDTVIRRHVLPLESRSSASSGNLFNILIDVILDSN